MPHAKSRSKPRARKAPARHRRPVRGAHGGGFADSFLSGLVAPFRAAGSVFKPFGFGLDAAANALNIPKIGVLGAGLNMVG